MNGRSDIEEMKQKLKRSRASRERLAAGSSSGDAKEDPGEDRTAHSATFHQGKNEGARPPGPHHDVDEEEIETYAPREKHRDAPKKQRRERPRLKFTRTHFYLMLLMLLVSLVGLLIWYVASSASEVKNIEISGNQLISDEEVEERLQFGTGDRMFSANLSRATENIAMLPAVEEVEIEREWWNTINVSVTEYQAVGYVANNSDYYPVLENAQVLRGSPSTPGSAPILHYFEGREFDRMVESLNDIEPDIREGISEIYYRPSENSSTRIHMFMNDGQEIVADYRTINEKMNYYLSMREEIGDPQSGLIDLEIGSSFLPYGSDEAMEVKAGIYEAPVQAPYIEEVNQALGDVKESLSNIGEAEDGEE
ncbi:cell division protein FtsQ/DivIB [Salinicoccus roseus]|uniref:cell division protein FtsQ/DivIB n=1 Tax=Salinicoccus roseus TaxID=45670 RepID=UPI00230076E2|nr:FtsQ-type POTRA domain-containing protein [Salinicoccus roseus]